MDLNQLIVKGPLIRNFIGYLKCYINYEYRDFDIDIEYNAIKLMEIDSKDFTNMMTIISMCLFDKDNAKPLEYMLEKLSIYTKGNIDVVTISDNDILFNI